MNIWRLGFLASHRGSNMQAVIDACKRGQIRAAPAVVISNNAASGALQRAEQESIPAVHLSLSQFADAAALDTALADTLLGHSVDLVVLAGYMKQIGAGTLAAFPGRIINVHPALLPKYGGRGMYGERVHAAVLAAGDQETGVTVHVVDEHYDQGRILAQRPVPVMAGDTVATLAERVLAVEHTLYPEVIAAIVEGRILP